MVNTELFKKYIDEIMDSDDIIERIFNCGENQCGIFYLDGMSDKLLLEQDVIDPLMGVKKISPTLEAVRNTVNSCEDIEEQENQDDAIKAVAEGDVVLTIDGAENYYIISLRKFQFRAITEPPTETVLKGPREGFTEEIKTNVTMIRRRLKTPKLRIKQFKVGKYSNTSIVIAYIDGIASQDTVEKISKKISAINIDGVIGTAYIERFVEENKRTIFNQSGTTEKPDIVVAKILEGKVAIIVDGTPVVATFPYLMFEDFQDGYDYFIRDSRSDMLRTVRCIGAVISVLLPGLYVAFQEYHYHLLPLKFLITLLNSVSGIPFTPPMEMLFVLILFEILNQASIRMPRYVGTALSIVGAIVLGETAVNAGLLSSPTVLIIAISAIGINCVPSLVDTFSLLRLGVLLIGSIFGLFGIIVFIVWLASYLAAMQNFDTPYLAPFAPIIPSDLKDAVFKDSLLDMDKRPYSIFTENRRRMKNGK